MTAPSASRAVQPARLDGRPRPRRAARAATPRRPASAPGPNTVASRSGDHVGGAPQAEACARACGRRAAPPRCRRASAWRPGRPSATRALPGGVSCTAATPAASSSPLVRQQLVQVVGRARGRRPPARPTPSPDRTPIGARGLRAPAARGLPSVCGRAGAPAQRNCGMTSVPISSMVCMTASWGILYGLTRHSSRSTPASS